MVTSEQAELGGESAGNSNENGYCTILKRRTQVLQAAQAAHQATKQPPPTQHHSHFFPTDKENVFYPSCRTIVLLVSLEFANETNSN
jgi:hypothetical protein